MAEIIELVDPENVLEAIDALSDEWLDARGENLIVVKIKGERLDNDGTCYSEGYFSERPDFPGLADGYHWTVDRKAPVDFGSDDFHGAFADLRRCYTDMQRTLELRREHDVVCGLIHAAESYLALCEHGEVASNEALKHCRTLLDSARKHLNALPPDLHNGEV